MWLLIACVASPGSVQCIEAQAMPSSSVCATIGQAYRQSVTILNPSARVDYKCIEVAANGSTRESSPPSIDIPKLPPARP